MEKWFIRFICLPIKILLFIPFLLFALFLIFMCESDKAENCLDWLFDLGE